MEIFDIEDIYHPAASKTMQELNSGKFVVRRVPDYFMTSGYSFSQGPITTPFEAIVHSI